MNFGFRVDADDFELKGELCSGTIWPRSDGTLRLGENHRRAAQALPLTLLTLGVVIFRSPMRNYFKYFLTSSLVLITAFSCIFCLNIFEKYLRLASVRYLSRRLPFFLFLRFDPWLNWTVRVVVGFHHFALSLPRVRTRP